MTGRGVSSAETIAATIDSVGVLGDGLSQVNGERIAVPLGLPGDHVRLGTPTRSGHGRTAEIVEILSPSQDRVPPPCPHFGLCGGCALQHWADERYAEWKLGLVADALGRQGIAVDLPPLLRTAPGSRRRGAFAARRDRHGLVLGFRARNSRRLVNLTTCLIVNPEIRALLQALRGLTETLLSSGEQADLGFSSTESGIDLLLTMPRAASLAHRELLAGFAATNDIARVAWMVSGGETAEAIVTRRPPRVTIGGVAVDIPPGAFLQPTAEGESAIVAEVVAGIGAPAGGTLAITDLYAGCGTLTLPLFRAFAGVRTSVHAVEGEAQMAKTLDAAGRRAGLAPRLVVETRDLARRPLLAAELARFDVAIFDPPRAGAPAQAAEIARSTIPLAVGVSCDASSFARDARILADGGFSIERIAALDQFPWSPHVEIVATFRRARPARIRA